MEQGCPVADMRCEKVIGADPLQSVIFEPEVAVDSAVDKTLEFDRAGIELISGNNFFGKSAASRNRGALHHSDLMLCGCQIRRAD